MDCKKIRCSISRPLFRKRFAEALLRSFELKMPMILFYDTSDSSFEYANTFNVPPELLPIVEVDANKIEHTLPLDDPKAVEALIKNNEEKILKRLLPELLDRLTPSAAR
ncbi:MAG: hypothetical protein LBT81_02135 [Helicobacteraceae bacterium]|jgi:hypothetical protein|nr:hypothetical protein [Helicobacteraceae bacterium]